jgi:hypothetical protein
VDLQRGAFISQKVYWSGQKYMGKLPMWTTFKLRKPTTIQFVISNVAPESHRSKWILRESSISTFEGG